MLKNMKASISQQKYRNKDRIGNRMDELCILSIDIYISCNTRIMGLFGRFPKHFPDIKTMRMEIIDA